MAESAPSPRRATSWHLSRFAPSPSLAEIQMREKRFVLDCVAVERISKDYSVSLPKLGSVIPPYNSQKDYHVRGYFLARPVPPVLKKTGQSNGGTSTYGELADRFQYKGAAAFYLLSRNNSGSDVTTLVIGHLRANPYHMGSIQSSRTTLWMGSLGVLGFAKGHSAEHTSGHGQFLSSVKPVIGYNGLYGYRRNTPSLRRMPSAFGIVTKSAIY